MKILIGGLVAESNAYVAKPCEIQDFVIQTGEDIAHRMYLDELQPELQANDIELIPRPAPVQVHAPEIEIILGHVEIPTGTGRTASGVQAMRPGNRRTRSRRQRRCRRNRHYSRHQESPRPNCARVPLHTGH